MKKTTIIALLLSVTALLSGCGHDEADSSSSSAISKKDTAVEVTETETEAITETEASTVPATTEKPTEAVSTTADPTPADEDYTGFAGYWYINGDPDTASFHITSDGKFTAYYASGYEEAKGYIKRELDTAINNYVYYMYLDSGEVYSKFADDGEKEKTDIYIGGATGDTDLVHFVKLFGEGGLGDDGRAPDEVFEGKWSCERANLTIENNGEGIFHATIKWGSSASSHVEWDYPLIFDGEKLVCEGTGTKTYVEYADAESEPSKTVEYTNGSAEFRIEGAGIVWDDLSENSGAGMVFKQTTDF